MTEQRFEKVRRNFTDDEILAFKDELARKTRETLELEASKAEVSGRMGRDLKLQKEEIALLSSQIATGFEWVEIEILTLMDQPQPGTKTLVRTDTGEELRQEPMTSEDRQRPLFEEPKEE